MPVLREEITFPINTMENSEIIFQRESLQAYAVPICTVGGRVLFSDKRLGMSERSEF